MTPMSSNDVIEHFNSLGIELEQYASEDELCEAMWEALQEDGLDNDNDYDVYYSCECAAGEMWVEHCDSLGVTEEHLRDVREEERVRRIPEPRPIESRKPFIEPDPVVVPDRYREEPLEDEVTGPLPVYVSEETRELERALEASRAKDRRRGELLAFLDTLDRADVALLQGLVDDRLYKQD